VIILVIAVCVLIVCTMVLALMLRVSQRHIRELSDRTAALESRLEDFGPLLADTRSALRKAESRNVKADDLVSAATALTDRADAATKLAYNVATSPLVRVAAIGRGLRRGAAALKDRPASPQTPTPTLPVGRRPEQPALPPSKDSGGRRAARRSRRSR
jgi:hypothetical protein